MKDKVTEVLNILNEVIIGKKEKIEIALCCLFAGGHLLLEDLPGTGKTTLAIALARLLGCSFARIQFTSDLLPSDILGGMIYNPHKGIFYFRPGPIFHNIILADEINRATPKTQSALLEAMEEHQITIEGETRTLPKPFFVIATQNPVEAYGTYPLPESQLDRFLIRISLDYPSFEDEINILKKGDLQSKAKSLDSIFSPQDILNIQKIIEKIKIHNEILMYMVDVVHKSRNHLAFSYGLSTRALQGWVKAAKAYAFIKGRNYVVPEDAKFLFLPISFHRLSLKESFDPNRKMEILIEFLDQFSLPQ